ncbi:MAG: hypothetical protein ACYDGS_05805 [Thermoleophilia bacterium]
MEEPAEKKKCWEIDWRSVVEPLAASQPEYWPSFLNNCGGCVAYKNYAEEMQARINAVKTLIRDD